MSEMIDHAWHNLLAMLMHKLGLKDVTFDKEDLAGIPRQLYLLVSEDDGGIHLKLEDEQSIPRSSLIQEDYCPKCHALLDCTTAWSQPDAAPKEGDLTVCAYCATPLVLDVELRHKLLTREDMEALEPEELDGLINAQNFVRAKLINKQGGE